jgi:hypothetical protein
MGLSVPRRDVHPPLPRTRRFEIHFFAALPVKETAIISLRTKWGAWESWAGGAA